MTTLHRPGGRRAAHESGLSLLELMVSVAIGSVLMIGLVSMFTNSSESRRELEKIGNLTENGRYAMNVLYEDLRHAGFYGYLYQVGDPPASMPDPCETSNLSALRDAMAMPVQGYAAPDFSTRADVSSTSCDDKGLLTAANLAPGSDVLVIRRAETAVFTGTPVANDVYIQTNVRAAELMFGDSGANVPATTAANTSQSMKKYPHSAASTEWADTRKYRVHVYFVAPCSHGTGTNGTCQAGDDRIPTLKRLELGSDGSGTAMTIVPLVEGIDYMKVLYGVDTTPDTVHGATGMRGDGMPDGSFVAAPSADQWPLVVAVEVHLLARSTDATQGHRDIKSYTLAGSTVGPFNDGFKRRAFSATVRPVNLAGRREIPK